MKGWELKVESKASITRRVLNLEALPRSQRKRVSKL